jgi:hypothetical protein
MNKMSKFLLTATLVGMLPLTGIAQEVRDREANQQGRIAQGIQSGQITAGGAAHLENREARIDASRRADLAANNGHLTANERRNLNRRENSTSRQIYRDKHNAITQPGVAPR